MGVSQYIGFDKETFPKQGKHLNKWASVCFNYDTSKRILGKIIRDDVSQPYLTIIKLEDDRVILATDCVIIQLLKKLVPLVMVKVVILAIQGYEFCTDCGGKVTREGAR